MPKGVYPRRPRMTKPLAVAKKKEAPKQPDPRLKGTLYEYMDSDPEVLRLDTQRNELRELINHSIQQSQKACHKVAEYYRSIQVLQNQVSAYQCCSAEEDEAVKELTGQYAEIVVEGFTAVSDELYGSMVAQSRLLTKHHDTATEMKASLDTLFQKWSAARTRARKEWEDHQAKLEKQEAK